MSAVAESHPRPRGQKTWALPGRLGLADQPVQQLDLALELFGEADDPLAALRWSLADLRRATGLKHVHVTGSVAGGIQEASRRHRRKPVQEGKPMELPLPLDRTGVMITALLFQLER